MTVENNQLQIDLQRESGNNINNSHWLTDLHTNINIETYCQDYLNYVFGIQSTYILSLNQTFDVIIVLF